MVAVPRVPLTYLDAVAPLHNGWEALPCWYLRLSEAYVDEEAGADAGLWPGGRAIGGR